jgi:hypothetical protein
MENLPKTHKEAVATGSRYYFTGKKCRGGHVSRRFTKNRNCEECLRERNLSRTTKGYWSEYGSDPEYRKKKREYARKYYQGNKDKSYFKGKRRWDLIQQATVATEAGMIEIKKIYLRAQMKTLETGIKYEVDHIIPLQHPLVSGLHVPNNLRITTAVENREKGSHFDPKEHEL